MGTIGVKIKLMPNSPESDLGEIAKTAKAFIEENGGRNREYEEEPIAFGLKALIVFFEWPEEKELQTVEDFLEKIENINSIKITDMRKIN